jgi:phospholipid transport system substrate-binding protein
MNMACLSLPAGAMGTKDMTFSMRLFVAAVAVSLASVSCAADAQEGPDALVERIAQDVRNSLANNKDIQAGMQKPLLDLIDARVMPFVDFQRATFIATGRAWRDATPEQQKELVDQFRTTLLFTYGGRLYLLRDRKIEYEPSGTAPADTEAEINTVVLQPNGPPLHLGYRLDKTPAGWKIYDLNIDGAGLIESYRLLFETEIAKGGIDGLIMKLAKTNQEFLPHR